LREFLAELIEMPGVSGYEEKIAKRISDEFSRYCDEVHTDSFFNVYGIKRGTFKDGLVMPKVMLAAHMDEIALMVRDIDEKGFLRFTNIAGPLPILVVIICSGTSGMSAQVVPSNTTAISGSI
jgi:putative aminopeptidase FrvX